MNKKLKQPTAPQHDAKLPVSGSVLFGYRFTITSNQNGSTLGTGFIKTERKTKSSLVVWM